MGKSIVFVKDVAISTISVGSKFTSKRAAAISLSRQYYRVVKTAYWKCKGIAETKK